MFADEAVGFARVGGFGGFEGFTNERLLGGGSGDGGERAAPNTLGFGVFLAHLGIGNLPDGSPELSGFEERIVDEDAGDIEAGNAHTAVFDIARLFLFAWLIIAAERGWVKEADGGKGEADGAGLEVAHDKVGFLGFHVGNG